MRRLSGALHTYAKNYRQNAGLLTTLGMTDSLQFFAAEMKFVDIFELQHSPTHATMFPGLGPDRTQRLYFLIEQQTSHS